MSLKKTFSLLAVFSCFMSFGQTKKIIRLNRFEGDKIKYGFYLGTHFKGYELQALNNVKLSQGAGFQLGVLADWNFSEYISLITEPGLISTTNRLNMSNTDFDIASTHFRFPLALKFKTKRINNIRAFVQSGIGYSYNFNSQRNNIDNGTNPLDFELSKHNFSAEIGFGTNFYFSKFKFSPSIRGIYGFNNEFKGLGTIAKSNITSLKTRGVFLTLSFQ